MQIPALAANSSDSLPRPRAASNACRIAAARPPAGTAAKALAVATFGALVLLAGADAAALNLEWTRVTPTVIRSDSTAPVAVTALISGGTPTLVQLALADGSVAVMRDDGTGGDKIAGDGIYTAQISATAAAGGLRTIDVFRKHLGFVDIYQGATRLLRSFVQSQVWTPEIGSVNVASPSALVQYSNYVMNVVDAPTSNAGASADFRTVTRKFYQYLPDNFDFLDVVFDASYTGNRYHFGVRNDVTGIGLNTANDAGNYGSGGTLQGLSIFPINTYFDPAEEAHTHEIGHQWIAFLPHSALAPGIPHWPLSTLAGGIMGYSIPGQGAGGTYSCRLTPGANGIAVTSFTGPRAFTDLDLYLMGLRPASQVGDHYVWIDQSAAANQVQSGCSGTAPYSQFYKVTIGSVIASAGTRQPAYPNARRDFRVGVIVVSDAKLSPEAMAYYDWFARRADLREAPLVHQGLTFGNGSPFFVATGGAGTMSSRLRDGAGAGTYVTVTEFYAPTLNHYFRTANAEEAAALKANPALGWQATGKDFKAYARNDSPGTAQQVCRFYGSLNPGPNSHFFTADNAECAALKQLQAQTPANLPRWNFEEIAFAVDAPAGGKCPAAAPVAIYRVYNDRAAQNDSNHRYATDQAVYQQMIALGWRGEGVVMCAPA